MLQAVLNHKNRGLEQASGVEAADYDGTEDFLTAAFFGRLVYLPDRIAWDLLRRALVGAEFPDPPGRLLEAAFWPGCNVRALEVDRFRVEPDVWLRFENLHLLVEAKRRDGVDMQTPKQLAWNWWAIQQREDFDSELPMFLLAVGGIETVSNAECEKWQAGGNQALELIPKKLPVRELRLAISSWRRLLEATTFFADQASDEGGVSRVLNDMKAALRLHGFVLTRWLADVDGAPWAEIAEGAALRPSWRDAMRAVGRIETEAATDSLKWRGRVR